MEYDIKLRVSNRHVHLTKEVYDELFDDDIRVKYYLNQIGEYASDKVLTIQNGDKEIPNVRVCGPFRSYNQVEISKRDARVLSINPPVRQSGDLADALEITLKTPKNEIKVKGLIIMGRHVHMNLADAKKFNVINKQPVKIRISNDKGGLLDAEVKISENGYYEAHLDTDDANATLIEDDDKGTLII